VVLHAGVGPAGVDLAEHCMAEGLARHKWPERLAVLDANPRNSMGKVLKADLRADLATRADLGP